MSWLWNMVDTFACLLWNGGSVNLPVDIKKT